MVVSSQEYMNMVFIIFITFDLAEICKGHSVKTP